MSNYKITTREELRALLDDLNIAYKKYLGEFEKFVYENDKTGGYTLRLVDFKGGVMEVMGPPSIRKYELKELMLSLISIQLRVDRHHRQ